jgi:phosphate:Na+ symporter
VALLLWGMRMVRTGVTRAFGTDLRHAIRYGVRNRFVACLTGLGVTAILQSSTATAIMVAAFASRGLIATALALAVMLGADIGTTLVAQVLSLDLSWLSPLLLLGGVVVHLASERTLVRQLARVAIGLGLMLLALKLIGLASQPTRESEMLHAVLGSLAGEPIIAILLAAVLTWIAHSSLAVVLLIMSLAAGGVVPLSLAFVMVLGANVGGTLPAITATLGEGPEARRVTFGNAFFKLVGCAVMLPLLDLVAPYLAMIETDPARQVVNFHTAFNLILAAAFLFLTDFVAATASRLFPALPEDEDPGRPRYLDESILDTPSVALTAATRETLRMGDLVETMLAQSIDALSRGDRALAAGIMKMDDAVDSLHEDIKLYVSQIARRHLDEPESHRATEIIAFTINLEHIGDIIENLMDLAQKKSRQRVQFSEAGLEDITALHHMVRNNLNLALDIFVSGDVKTARQLLMEKRRVRDLERLAADSHFQRLREGRTESIETSALHLDILRDLKRIHSHIASVAYPVLEAAGELRTTRLKKRARQELKRMSGDAPEPEKPAGADAEVLKGES